MAVPLSTPDLKLRRAARGITPPATTPGPSILIIARASGLTLHAIYIVREDCAVLINTRQALEASPEGFLRERFRARRTRRRVLRAMVSSLVVA